MKIVSDLHIHSRFSRATSKDITIPNLDKYSRMKGIGLVGTGDFTHPQWFREIKETLKEEGDTGIFEHEKGGTKFLLSSEISLMYTQDGRGRRVHFVILAPGLDVAEQVTDWLKTKGRVDYDGRPIFGFPSTELVENLVQISKDIMIIPAHIWTPWFGILGEKTGFNSIEECFGDQSGHIHALETGLSSDPAMNWRVSSLDRYALVSNSDCHSYWPWRLGREANVFDLRDVTYRNIVNAIMSKDPRKFLYTIEVDPSYGKYHWDGHRNCHVCLEPKEALKHKNICPVCKKPMTIGVLHRVEELADRPEGYVPKNAVPFKTLIPLSEIIASLLGTTPATKAVWDKVNRLISEFGSELNVLLDASEEKMKAVVNDRIADAVIRNREGRIDVQPGYDGEYGKPLFGTGQKVRQLSPQKRLGEF